MSFLLSVNLFEDQWSFIILRDMLLLKRASIKEFRDPRKNYFSYAYSKKRQFIFYRKTAVILP